MSEERFHINGIISQKSDYGFMIDGTWYNFAYNKEIQARYADKFKTKDHVELTYFTTVSKKNGKEYHNITEMKSYGEQSGSRSKDKFENVDTQLGIFKSTLFKGIIQLPYYNEEGIEESEMNNRIDRLIYNCTYWAKLLNGDKVDAMEIPDWLEYDNPAMEE